jgi:hypothetical protein
MAFQKLRKSVGMRLKTVLFVSAEGDSENSVFTHHEFTIFQLLLEAFEIVS